MPRMVLSHFPKRRRQLGSTIIANLKTCHLLVEVKHQKFPHHYAISSGKPSTCLVPIPLFFSLQSQIKSLLQTFLSYTHSIRQDNSLLHPLYLVSLHNYCNQRIASFTLEFSITILVTITDITLIKN